MLGFVCGVSQYPHFFVTDLDIYHVLPRPYLWSFDDFPKDKLIVKNGCYTWQVEQKHLSGNVFNPG